MKRRSFAAFLTFFVLFISLSFSVFADVSVPDGYDVSLPLSSYNFSVSSGVGTFSFDSLPLSSPNLLDNQFVSTGVSLGDTFSSVFSDFSVLGYINSDHMHTYDLQFNFVFDPGYSKIYVVVPRYWVYNVSGNYRSILNCVVPDGVSFLSYNRIDFGKLDWTPIYNGGPTVYVEYGIYAFDTPTVSIRYRYSFDPSEWSGPYNLSAPVYSPLAFTTQSSAEAYVRDKLSSISDGLDDVNSRLDELENGLFNPPSGWSDFNQSVQDAYNDQASIEASLDAEANSIIDNGFSGLSYDPEAIASEFNQALGGDDYWAGSDMTSLFRWLWEINPMIVIEVSIVGGFFVVGLIVRTYS